MDDINDLIGQSIWYAGYPYNQPAHLMAAYQGPYGTPYWTYQLPLLTPYPGTIEVPDVSYQQAAYTTVQQQQTPVLGYGAAPATSYTGVEDHCG